MSRKGSTAVRKRFHIKSDATCAAGRTQRRMGVPRMPARRRAYCGPRQGNTKEKANMRGARSALQPPAIGRARVTTTRASTSSLSCQRNGGRRLVALLCQGTLSRNRIQTASRRRYPRQAHHRKHIQAASRRRQPRRACHRLRPKKGSQPWRRRWLIFDSELPSWRSTPRARPPVEASRGLIPWLPFAQGK